MKTYAAPLHADIWGESGVIDPRIPILISIWRQVVNFTHQPI